MADAGQPATGGAGQEGQRVVMEVPHHRVVDTAVRGITEGVAVDRLEPLDVIGHLRDRQPQQHRSQVPLGAAPFLQPVPGLQIRVERLDERIQRGAVTVVDRRPGDPGQLGQLGDGDLGDGPLRGEPHDGLSQGAGRPGDTRIGPLAHSTALQILPSCCGSPATSVLMHM